MLVPAWRSRLGSHAISIEPSVGVEVPAWRSRFALMPSQQSCQTLREGLDGRISELGLSSAVVSCRVEVAPSRHSLLSLDWDAPLILFYLMNIALKGSHFCFLFAFTAAGVM